jgi:hypothetical protein
MICTACNWTRHDVSIHGELCKNGHPIEIVGRYTNGSCRACQRAVVKRYYWAHREKRLAQWRAWRDRTRPPISIGGQP